MLSGQVGDKIRSNERESIIVQIWIVVDLTKAFEGLGFGLSDLSLNTSPLLFYIHTHSLLHTGLCLGVCFAIGLSIDCRLLELHDVLSKRASLVRKDVLNLAHVVGDVPGFRDARLIDGCVVHFDVAEDEYGLKRPHDFQCDIERNRNQVLEQNNGCPKGDETTHRGASTNGLKLKEMERSISLGPSNTIHNGGKKTHDEKNSKVADDVEVHLSGNSSALAWRNTGIHHDSRVMARENNDTKNPLSIAQVTASKHKIINGDRLSHVFRVIIRISRNNLLPVNSSIILVEVRVGSFTLNLELSTLCVTGMPNRSATTKSLSDLQVSLTIQVLGLNVTGSVWIGRGQDDDIGRQFVVVVNTHEITNFEAFPGILLETRAFGWLHVINQVGFHVLNSSGTLCILFVRKSNVGDSICRRRGRYWCHLDLFLGINK
uniref:Uncharacterized protein n=1 Tax=Photinus pyralis TaxID=7054 RepID=A0A1Y1NGU5_PHOPY